MFNIDFQSRIPIYEQIINQVERFIVLGILKENEQLPSIRQVAFELGINPNTIQRAYAELEHKGIIVSVIGKGSFITDNIYHIIDDKTDKIINEIKNNIEVLNKMGLNKKTIQDRIFNN